MARLSRLIGPEASTSPAVNGYVIYINKYKYIYIYTYFFPAALGKAEMRPTSQYPRPICYGCICEQTSLTFAASHLSVCTKRVVGIDLRLEMIHSPLRDDSAYLQNVRIETAAVARLRGPSAKQRQECHSKAATMQPG